MDYQYVLGAFFLASALIGIFLLVILATEKGNNLSRKILLALLGVMVLVLMDTFFISVKFFQLVPHSLFLFSSFWLAVPALIFLYDRSYLRENQSFKWWDTLHFIPFLVYFIISFRFYGFSAEHKLKIGEFIYHQSPRPSLFSLIFFMQNFLYLPWAWVLQKREDSFQTRWLRSFWIIWLVVVMVDFVLTLIRLTEDINVSLYKDLVILFYAFQVYYIAYCVLKKPFLFLSRIKATSSGYHSSSISEERLQILSRQLKKAVEEKKFFLDPNLKQSDLARHIDVNRVVLSQVFHSIYQQNFNEWINTYRISYACKKIKEGFLNQYSIEALAQESGFGNKVSFYRNFKRITGKTPSSYHSHQKERAALHHRTKTHDN